MEYSYASCNDAYRIRREDCAGQRICVVGYEGYFVSLLDVVRSGVAIANTVTAPLQGTVTYQRYVSADGYGAKTYATATSLAAIVEEKQRQVRSASGVLVSSKSSALFLDIGALSTATLGNGISTEDLLTLPDGTTGPILAMDGFVDAGTGHLIATQVYLG